MSERSVRPLLLILKRGETMRVSSLVLPSILLFALHFSTASNPDRTWQTAQVTQIRHASPRGVWEYDLTSNKLVYTLQNGLRDAPYLNSSLGAEVKIAPATSGSKHPYDGDEVYVMDADGKEHKMDLVSVVMTDAGCKQ
jgi:hypothetical protein